MQAITMHLNGKERKAMQRLLDQIENDYTRFCLSPVGLWDDWQLIKDRFDAAITDAECPVADE